MKMDGSNVVVIAQKRSIVSREIIILNTKESGFGNSNLSN